MKKVVGSILLAIAVLSWGFVLAQDTSAITATATSLSLPSWVPKVLAIAVTLYELIVRYFPTAKNYSITGGLIRLFQAVVPNRNSETPTKPHP